MKRCEMVMLLALEDHENTYQEKGRVQKLTLGNLIIMMGKGFSQDEIEAAFNNLIDWEQVHVEVISGINHIWHKQHVAC